MFVFGYRGEAEEAKLKFPKLGPLLAVYLLGKYTRIVQFGPGRIKSLVPSPERYPIKTGQTRDG